MNNKGGVSWNASYNINQRPWLFFSDLETDVEEDPEEDMAESVEAEEEGTMEKETRVRFEYYTEWK